MKYIQNVHPFVFILICTVFEATGDAIIRKSLYNNIGTARIGLMLVGMILLLGYGIFLNLAPVEFGRIVGLYIATLFVVWQVVNYISFKSLPTIPVIVGGLFIITGGLITTFWKSK